MGYPVKLPEDAKKIIKDDSFGIMMRCVKIAGSLLQPTSWLVNGHEDKIRDTDMTSHPLSQRGQLLLLRMLQRSDNERSIKSLHQGRASFNQDTARAIGCSVKQPAAPSTSRSFWPGWRPQFRLLSCSTDVLSFRQIFLTCAG